jgi:hypothetical protein
MCLAIVQSESVYRFLVSNRMIDGFSVVAELLTKLKQLPCPVRQGAGIASFYITLQ